MLMITLAVSCLTTSNLPWFMDLTFQIAMQYCSLQRRTLLPSPIASTNGCCFLLWLCLFILSGVISPLISCSILGTYRPGEFICQCTLLSPFHAVHGVLKVRKLKWFAIPFPSGYVLSELSTVTRPSWVALYGMAHSFFEQTKLWSMLSVWLVFCDCGCDCVLWLWILWFFHPSGG